MVDWKECINKRIAKNISKDKNMIRSIHEMAEMKISSADTLPEEHFISKITLLYDALREYLECNALEKGYKIYNHECYTAFIKEIIGNSCDGDIFDSLRKTRNSINYYGKKVDKEEAKQVISDLKLLIKKYK